MPRFDSAGRELVGSGSGLFGQSVDDEVEPIIVVLDRALGGRSGGVERVSAPGRQRQDDGLVELDLRVGGGIDGDGGRGGAGEEGDRLAGARRGA